MGDVIGIIVIAATFLGIGYVVGAGSKSDELTAKYEKMAVQSGCAIRALDSLSGDVKTVWKGEKE